MPSASSRIPFSTKCFQMGFRLTDSYHGKQMSTTLQLLLVLLCLLLLLVTCALGYLI